MTPKYSIRVSLINRRQQRCICMPSNYLQQTTTFFMTVGVESADGNISLSLCMSFSFSREQQKEEERNTRRRAVNLLTVLMIHQQIQCSHIKLPFSFLSLIVYLTQREYSTWKYKTLSVNFPDYIQLNSSISSFFSWHHQRIYT